MGIFFKNVALVFTCLWDKINECSVLNLGEMQVITEKPHHIQKLCYTYQKSEVSS